MINLPGVNKPRAGFKCNFTSVLQEEASNSPEKRPATAQRGPWMKRVFLNQELTLMLWKSGKRSGFSPQANDVSFWKQICADRDLGLISRNLTRLSHFVCGGAFRTLPQPQVISPRPSPFGVQSRLPVTQAPAGCLWVRNNSFIIRSTFFL